MRSSDQRAPTAKRAPRRSSADVVSQLQQAEILLSISQKVAAAQTLDEALDTVVQFTTLATGAERGTLFLNDARTGELYARVALGYLKLEIRMLNTTGLAGFVYTSGEGLICHDAYADDRFSSHVDEQTEFVTKNVLCAPVKTVNGEIIGVIQTLNKTEGQFTEDDLALLEAMATQAAGALQSNQIVERMEKSRTREMEFFDVVSEVSSEIQLGTLLQKIMAEVSRMLNTERSTLFLNDEKTNELWSEVGSGLDAKPIRFPNHMGVAGAVFTSGESVNIPHAYADLRFNPAVDRETGYFTRSMLCVPVVNKHGKTIGVTQVLNKRGSAFTEDDESRLRAFTAQVSIALENAKLFDEVQKIKHYNESMLESMSNGVITVDEDGKIITCNVAGLRIMQVAPADILERQAKEFFVGASSWVPEKVERVAEMQASELTMDAEMEFDGQKLSVNLTVLPLISAEKNRLGSMIMIEDITSEKRVKSTMARYMDPSI
ncbi:MAG: GAF domain-containing protein, partial [Gammaproteobacteria bacterium]